MRTRSPEKFVLTGQSMILSCSDYVDKYGIDSGRDMWRASILTLEMNESTLRRAPRAHEGRDSAAGMLAMAAACACAIQVHAVVAAAAPANSPERGYRSASPIELWQLETVLVNLFILYS